MKNGFVRSILFHLFDWYLEFVGGIHLKRIGCYSGRLTELFEIFILICCGEGSMPASMCRESKMCAYRLNLNYSENWWSIHIMINVPTTDRAR